MTTIVMLLKLVSLVTKVFWGYGAGHNLFDDIQSWKTLVTGDVPLLRSWQQQTDAGALSRTAHDLYLAIVEFDNPFDDT